MAVVSHLRRPWPEPEGGSTQLLVDFLASAWAEGDQEAVCRDALERVVSGLNAGLACVVRQGLSPVVTGRAADAVAPADIVAVAEGRTGILAVPQMGLLQAVSVALDDDPPGRLMAARAAAFSAEETELLRGMARVLTITLRMRRTLSRERAQAQENASLVEHLRHRQALLEQLSRIGRQISRGTDQQSVLDMIAAAARELLGGEMAGLRLTNPIDRSRMVLVASDGMEGRGFETSLRDPVDEGVDGQAIAEERLVVLDCLSEEERTLAGREVAAAMAAPVYESGAVIGSLFVASDHPQRRYSGAEQETLLALAEHASLALTEARTVQDAFHRSLHDALTELPNRALFTERLEHALTVAERSQRTVAVLFLDLDGFKRVNDSLGHGAGDELLVAVSRRLRRSVRPGDSVARFGGDEFAVLLEDLADGAEAQVVAERILAELARPFELRSRQLTIGASIGVAHGTSPRDDVVRAADLAMYRAKDDGKACVRVFREEMGVAVALRLDLELDLRAALERGAVDVHFQPIVDIATGEALGMEALARWCHPRRGWVSPAEFVPIAEETGLVLALGDYVLRHACAVASEWSRPLPVSVNLSAVQLEQPNLDRSVRAALAESGLPPERLLLEITETVLMRDASAAAARLERLKELGIALYVDDFGTGYWSLLHLERLPLEGLKMAKTFVDALTEPGNDPAVARAIIDIGKSFALDVIAEGIETAGQRERLLELGFTLGQGFLFARPVPAHRIEALLKAPLG
ncbi:MAG TPA: EAL domain-containing protein [Gaiellaceae bacterium]|nr:EAL domain-containing protein [Gaiellaceae bacterium]